MATASQRKLLFFFLISLPLAGLAVLIFLAYDCAYPRDEVRVNVTGIPDDVYFLCFVAQAHGKLHAMKWYRSHIFGPFTMSDLASGGDRPDASDFQDRVAWRFGERYGVITRSRDREWRITWFEAGEVPLFGRSLLTGQGTATFDLTKGQTEPLAAGDVESLGLRAVLDRSP